MQERSNCSITQYFRVRESLHRKKYNKKSQPIWHAIQNSNLKRPKIGLVLKYHLVSSNASVECYLILSPKLLREPVGSKATIYYSNEELYDYIKTGILLI